MGIEASVQLHGAYIKNRIPYSTTRIDSAGHSYLEIYGTFIGSIDVMKAVCVRTSASHRPPLNMGTTFGGSL